MYGFSLGGISYDSPEYYQNILHLDGAPIGNQNARKYPVSETGSTVKTGYDLSKTVNIKAEVKVYGANTLSKQGFTSYKGMMAHWEGNETRKGHKEEYEGTDIKTVNDYKKRALELAQSACSDTIDGFIDNKGNICRYDKETNDFVKADPTNGVITMFKPKGGQKYFDHHKKTEKGDYDE